MMNKMSSITMLGVAAAMAALSAAAEFVREDELVEVTPVSLRLRKAELSALKRYQTAGRIAKGKA